MNIVENFRSFLQQNRSVYRAGWLCFMPFGAQEMCDENRFWVVFSVYDDQTPYLEFYRQRQNINSAGLFSNEGPVSKHSLKTCRFITTVISIREEPTHEFNIGLSSQVIRLAAETDEVMNDWIQVLKCRLQEMRILQPPENQYAKPPEVLPPIPVRTSQEDTFYEPIFDDEAPPPYSVECSALPVQTSSLSFREAQVEKLKKEIADVDGLRLSVRRKDLLNAVALVDVAQHGIFFVGWRQRQCPHLHSIFHIGDQLIAINDQSFNSVQDARSFLKFSCSHTVDIHLRRLPYAQIFCLKRDYERQKLGLIREKGTAEIKEVILNSLSHRAGLTTLCSFYRTDNEGSIKATWQLTEVNNRPLNLFHKNNEIESRLHALGKEISILVQPTGFIHKLRKQLKISVKNYKDFIVQ